MSVSADDTVLVGLIPVVKQLKEIVVSERVKPSSNFLKLPLKALKDIPSLLGERDMTNNSSRLKAE